MTGSLWSLGIELELAILLAVTTVGQIVFGVFETETSRARRLLKWTIIDGATVGLYYAVGHWALLLPLLMLAAGITVHTVFCRRHGIDWLRATPRRRYYELRGWAWPD